MKTVLFCNSIEPQCGVYQYGRNLFAALQDWSEYRAMRAEPELRLHYKYLQPQSAEEVMEECAKAQAVAILYNWHPDMGGWMKEAPFDSLKPAKQLLIYHDWEPDTARFDAVLFSDPTMERREHWYSIGRPLPHRFPKWPDKPIGLATVLACPVVGVHGFFGATADLVVKQVLQEFEKATIRLHAPFAHFGDREGKTALELVGQCRELLKDKPDIQFSVTHEWKSADELLDWLHDNDVNCYFRDKSAKWRGVSSALDAAVAAGKPVAINQCDGFRHLFGCQPSICIEDRTLKEIITTGTEPLKPFAIANDGMNVGEKVEAILLNLMA